MQQSRQQRRATGNMQHAVRRSHQSANSRREMERQGKLASTQESMRTREACNPRLDISHGQVCCCVLAESGQLRPYQLNGFRWLAGNIHNGFGCILADDMGLGKTLQCLALLLHMKEPQLVLLIIDAGSNSCGSVQSVWCLL